MFLNSFKECRYKNKIKKSIKLFSLTLLLTTFLLSSCDPILDPTLTTTDSASSETTSEPTEEEKEGAVIGSNTHWYVDGVDTGVIASIHVPDHLESDYELYLNKYSTYNESEETWIEALYYKTLVNIHDVIVSFNTKGGELVEEVTLTYGDIVDEPLTIKEDYKLEGWYEYNKKWLFESYLLTKDITLIANWTYYKTSEYIDVPIFNIDLKGKNISEVNREQYVDASISITNSGKYEDLFDLDATFKGRGHGSWEFDKKGYRIKFDKKQSLFGEAKSKHWVIVANGHDDSMIRHNLAYTITKETLSYIEYQTSVNVIEVYFNGNYHGVYSLFEHVRVDKDRVNIESEYGVLDTGYLLEYDAYSLIDYDESDEGVYYFKNKGLKYPFEVKRPDPGDYLEEGLTREQFKEQVAYIQNYLQQVINAVLSQNFILFNELADVNSLVDMYLIHELFKNTDTGWSSFYVYKKPDGKLYAGPAWDFDFSSGISRGDSTYKGFYVSDKVLEVSEYTANELFISLMTQETFINLFKERF